MDEKGTYLLQAVRADGKIGKTVWTHRVKDKVQVVEAPEGVTEADMYRFVSAKFEEMSAFFGGLGKFMSSVRQSMMGEVPESAEKKSFTDYFTSYLEEHAKVKEVAQRIVGTASTQPAGWPEFEHKPPALASSWALDVWRRVFKRWPRDLQAKLSQNAKSKAEQATE